MAVRFYSDFQNDRGRYFRVRLHDTDFSGSATEVTSGAEGFSLDYDGGNQEVFLPIMASRLRFVWFNDGGNLDTFLNDVVPTRNEAKLLVDVYSSLSEIDDDNAGEAFWRGVLLSEQIVQADEPTPSAVEFTATDDLKQLKEHTDVPGTATAAANDTTLRGYLVNCLSFARSYSLWDTDDVFLYYFNDFEPDGYSGSDALVSMFINHLWRNGSTPSDSDYYYDAYTILEDLAQSFNARVFQANGRWYFMPLNILQRRADDDDFSAALRACKKDTTPVTIIASAYNAWRNNQLITDSEATKLAGGSREYSLGVKSVKRTRLTGANDFILRGVAFNFPQLDESTNDVTVSDGDFTYYSGQTFTLVYGYNINVPSVDSANTNANFLTLQANIYIQFGSQWFTENGWVGTATPYRLVVGEFYKSFGFNEGGEIPIQIEPLPSTQTGADLTLNLKALGIGGGEVTDDLPASHYANQSVTLYFGEEGTGQGDGVVFESETSEDNQERIEQDDVVIGTTQLTNGVIAGSPVQVNTPNGSIELTAGPVVDFTSSQTSTAYSLHRLGVREAVEALQLPHEIRNGAFYVEAAATTVWPYSLFSEDSQYWGVHELTYRANASEVTVERFQLKRDTSNIVFLDDVTTGVDESGQAPTQGSTAARTAAEAFRQVQTGELAEFVNVTEIEHSVGDTYTIDSDDNNGYVYFNRWIDSANGFSSIVLPKVADNEGRVIRLKTDDSVAANKYIKLGPNADDYTNGTRIDGADSFALNRDYDGISVLCFESQWYVIQRKGKSQGEGVEEQYHNRYSSDAETLRSGATDTVEAYYTARPDGDGYATSEVDDTGETDTINRKLYYSEKFKADPDTAADWTEYTAQPADNETFDNAVSSLLDGLNETDATAETRGTLPVSLKMVRTTTPAVTPLLLDDYPAEFAVSVRKLDKDYTGSCMKVRRASDNTEQDIGFDNNGDLDTAAIATFCGSSNGFVSVWYDQANIGGTAKNLVQSTTSKQPKIYNGTSVLTEGGKPCVDFDGTDDGLNCATNLRTSAGASTVVTVSKVPAQSTLMQTFAFYTVQRHIQHTGFYSNKSISTNRLTNRYKKYGSANLANQQLQFSTWDGTAASPVDDIVFHIDGVAQTATNGSGGYAVTPSGHNCIGFRSDTNNQYVNGSYQEVIVYLSDEASNRTSIESDINTYFSL